MGTHLYTYIVYDNISIQHFGKYRLVYIQNKCLPKTELRILMFMVNWFSLLWAPKPVIPVDRFFIVSPNEMGRDH